MNLRLVEGCDPPVALVGLRESGVMHRVNANLRELSESFPHSEPLAFFCECRNAACYSVISMSAAEFDVTEANRIGWLLVDGHESSTPWPTREARDSGTVGAGVVVMGGWAPKRIGDDAA